MSGVLEPLILLTQQQPDDIRLNDEVVPLDFPYYAKHSFP